LGDVRALARGQNQSHGITQRIDERMQFGGKAACAGIPARATSERLVAWGAFLTGSALVGPDAGRVEHNPLEVGVLKRLEDTVPDAGAQRFLRTSPTAKSPVDAVPFAILFRKVAPRRAGATGLEHRVDELAVVAGRNASVDGFTGQEVHDASVLLVGDSVTSHNVFDRASDLPTSKAIVHTL